MSGSIIPTPAYKAGDWQNFGDQVEKQRLGFIALSLTNYDNDSVPQIAGGSVVEISGSIFRFTAADSISGTPTSGQINYIMLEVSGSGDSQTVAGSWATTAPTWNDTKQGYYDAGGTKRYIGGCYYDGTNYLQKWIYHNRDFGPRTIELSILLVGWSNSLSLQLQGYRAYWNAVNASGYMGFPYENGDIVTELYSYCGSLSTGTIYVRLYYDSVTGASPVIMAQNSHTSAATGLTDTSITAPVIDTNANEYYIQLASSTSMTSSINGVRIKLIRIKRWQDD